jgi:hypothetical protein
MMVSDDVTLRRNNETTPDTDGLDFAASPVVLDHSPDLHHGRLRLQHGAICDILKGVSAYAAAPLGHREQTHQNEAFQGTLHKPIRFATVITHKLNPLHRRRMTQPI